MNDYSSVRLSSRTVGPATVKERLVNILKGCGTCSWFFMRIVIRRIFHFFVRRCDLMLSVCVLWQEPYLQQLNIFIKEVVNQQLIPTIRR